jgi:hypothetical protein
MVENEYNTHIRLSVVRNGQPNGHAFQRSNIYFPNHGISNIPSQYQIVETGTPPGTKIDDPLICHHQL